MALPDHKIGIADLAHVSQVADAHGSFGFGERGIRLRRRV
jgi:hypothetical protein